MDRCSLLLACLLLAACGPAEAPPPGDWANVDLATVVEVRPHGERRLARIEEGSLLFWADLPGAIDLTVGDSVLLGKGPEVTAEIDGRRVRDVLRIEEVAVVSPEVAVLATKLPPLPDERTPIATLHAEAAAREGQPVVVAGRVVKASLGVFDTNWYHLRDGTGSSEDGTDDVTFTSGIELAVGDAVVAEGPLIVDRNLGFGYRYPVILEGPEVRDRSGAVLVAAGGNAIPEAGAAAPAISTGEETEVEAPVAAERPERPSLGPSAPTRTVFGLELGVSNDEHVQRWGEGLGCTSAAAFARRTLHTTCADVGDRWPSSGAPRVDVLIARPESASTIHHVSSSHAHAIAVEAVADWRERFAALEDELGPPSLLREPEERPTLTGRFGWRAVWSWDDLEVELTVSRFTTSGPARVRERWFVPGVEESLPDRGVGVHGRGVRSVQNPHRG